jgi:hypothetical protein
VGQARVVVCRSTTVKVDSTSQGGPWKKRRILPRCRPSANRAITRAGAPPNARPRTSWSWSVGLARRCRSVIGAAYEPLGIAIERCAVIGAPQCSTVAALGPIRKRDVGTISGRHLPTHYGNPMLRLQRADAVGAAGGRPLLPSLAGRVRPQSRRERGRGAPGTTGGQHSRAGASPAPVGRPRPTMDGGATPAGGGGDISGPRMLPLLLPLNSAIPGGQGGRSGYAHPL